MGRLKTIAGVILGIVVVLAVAYWVGARLSLLSGFPKGVDAYAHLTRVVWILERFPQIHWNPSWNSGTFFWLWSYPPTGSIVTAAVVKLLGISVEQALNYVSFASFAVFVLSLFAVLSSWSGVWFSIPITLLAVTTPALWSWWGHGGNYVRIWGLGFYGLSMFLLVRYLRSPSKLTYVLLVLALGFSMSTHMLFGGLTILTVGAYLLFAVSGWRSKILAFLKTLGMAFLLSGFWYIPMLTASTGSRFIQPAEGEAISLKDMIFVDPQYPYFSMPAIFTVTATLFLLLAIFWALWKKKGADRLTWAVIPAFILGTLSTLVYILIGLLPGYPERGYLAVFPPFATLPIFIIYASFLMAGVLGILTPRFKNSLWAIFISLIGGFLIVVSFQKTNIFPWSTYNMTRPDQRQAVSIPFVTKLDLDQEYRFGTDSALVSDWFNYIYPNLPQTRDYIYQGIPYKTWQYLQEYVIWTQEGRYNETEWLLDWYGVKYFTVGFGSPETKFEKFLDREGLFQIASGHKGDDYEFYVFEYKKAKPILSAADASPILIFGKEIDYEILVRTYALANWGTDLSIPVYGGERVSGINFEDLTSFPTLFLYRLKPKELEEDWDLIKRYLDEGGRVVIEVSPDSAAEVTTLPSWYPVNKLQVKEVSGSWSFSMGNEVSGMISEAEFSPPRFGDFPWKAVVGEPLLDSKVWLAINDAPVVISREVGKGEVVWSGLNLPYHIESHKNEAETKLLAKILAVDPKLKELTAVKTLKNEPEKRVWQVNTPSKGFIWKESYFPRWNIYAKEGSSQKKLSYYLAGPNLIYIPLSKIKAPVTIEAYYQTTFIDKLGWGVSLATLSLLLTHLLEGKVLPPVITNLSLRLKDKFKPVGKWWDKDNV